VGGPFLLVSIYFQMLVVVALVVMIVLNGVPLTIKILFQPWQAAIKLIAALLIGVIIKTLNGYLINQWASKQVGPPPQAILHRYQRSTTMRRISDRIIDLHTCADCSHLDLERSTWSARGIGIPDRCQ